MPVDQSNKNVDFTTCLYSVSCEKPLPSSTGTNSSYTPLNEDICYLQSEVNRLDCVAARQEDLINIFLSILDSEPYDLYNFWVTLDGPQTKLVKSALVDYRLKHRVKANSDSSE